MGRKLLCQREDNHQFTGKSIKQLAGVGAVYIRLTKKIPSHVVFISDDSDFEPLTKIRCVHSDSDSSFELPPFPSGTRTSPSQSAPSTTLSIMSTGNRSELNYLPTLSTDVVTEPITPLNRPASTPSSSSPTSPVHDSHSIMISESVVHVPPSSLPSTTHTSITSSASEVSMSATTTVLQHILDDSMTNPLPTNAPPTNPPPNCSTMHFSLDIPHIEDPFQSDDLDRSATHAEPTTLEGIQERYSSLSMEDITMIYEVSGRSYERTVDFLKNQTLDNMLNLLYDYFIELCTEESPKLQMKPDASDQEMAELVLGFYKSSRFSKNSCVRVTHGQAIDSGGVRRQLFSSAFNAIADGHLQIFEGPSTRVSPAIKPCNIVSGLLKNLGKAIAHHLVMDKSGFPFLSPPIFYYLVGEDDIAITLLEDFDVSGQALHVIKKVN